MELILRKLFRNLITLTVVVILITLLASLPKNFNFNYSFTDIWKQATSNLKDAKDSLMGVKNYNGVPIQEIVSSGFLRSYRLVFTALLLSILMGVIKGVTDFNIKKQDTSLYRLLHTLFMLSVPDVLVIILFRLGIKYVENEFGITLLPTVGYRKATNLILPAITLSIVPIVYVARATTTSLRQIYKKPFMIVAKGKGLSTLYVLLKHALRNCLNIILDTTVGVFNIIMSSLLIVEMFYYYPGVTMQMLEFYHRGHAYMFIIYGLFLGMFYALMDLIIELLKIYFDPERRGELIG